MFRFSIFLLLVNSDEIREPAPPKLTEPCWFTLDDCVCLTRMKGRVNPVGIHMLFPGIQRLVYTTAFATRYHCAQTCSTAPYSLPHKPETAQPPGRCWGQAEWQCPGQLAHPHAAILLLTQEAVSTEQPGMSEGASSWPDRFDTLTCLWLNFILEFLLSQELILLKVNSTDAIGLSRSIISK